MKKFLAILMTSIFFFTAVEVFTTSTEVHAATNQIASNYTAEFQGFYNEIKNSKILTIDGEYGPATEKAYVEVGSLIKSSSYYCKKFQHFMNLIDDGVNLDEDGIYGANTENAYRKLKTMMTGSYVVNSKNACLKFQSYYNCFGRTTLVEDGEYGPATERAYQDLGNLIRSDRSYCSSFQSFYNAQIDTSAHLDVDGLWGPKTSSAYTRLGQLIRG